MRSRLILGTAGASVLGMSAMPALAQIEVGGSYATQRDVIVTLKVLFAGMPVAQDSDTTTITGTLRSVVSLSSRPVRPSDIATTAILDGRVEAWDLSIPDGNLNLLGVNVRLEGFRYLFGDCFGQPGTPVFNFFGLGQASLDQLIADVNYQGRIILSGGTPPFAFNQTVELAPLSGFSNIFSTYSLEPTPDLQGVRQKLRIDNAGPIADDFTFGGFTFRLEVAIAGGGASVEGFDEFEPSRIVCCPQRISPGTFHDGGGTAEFPVGFGLNVFAVADFTGDGHEDVALAVGSRIDVLPSVHPGTFGAPLSFDLPPSASVKELRGGDFDADGDTDLLIVDQTSSSANAGMHIAVNRGDGTFAAPNFFPVGPLAFAADVGDIEGDGDLDVVVVCERLGNLPKIFVMRNDGAGTFGAPEGFATGNSVSGVAVGDLDGDGDLDMALPLGSVDFLGFRRNDGAGNFTSITGFNLVPSGGDRPIRVVLCDLDNDNDLDAVTLNSNSENISRLQNNNGLFTNASIATFPLSVTDDPASIDAADIDGDGDLDLAVGYRGLFPTFGGVNTLANDGTGAFGATVNHAIAHAQVSHLAFIDLDRDADADLLLATQPRGFEPQNLTTLMNGCTGEPPAPACPADYTRDGGVDGDDVGAFFADWEAGQAGADFNLDGGVDGDDVIEFFRRWEAGC